VADSVIDTDEFGPVLKRAISELLPDERDREVLNLMMERERNTAAFARILQIEHLPVADQRRRVKQTKDRIRLRVKRYLERSGNG
jgi:hypothetical protein